MVGHEEIDELAVIVSRLNRIRVELEEVQGRVTRIARKVERGWKLEEGTHSARLRTKQTPVGSISELEIDGRTLREWLKIDVYFAAAAE